MRRSLIALAAAIAVLLVTVTAAVAVLTARGGDQAPAYRSHGTMWSSHSFGTMSTRRMGPGRWMHGTAVNTEFAYLAEMVAHHREAVSAAKELQRSGRPELRAFGGSIVKTQTAQIDQMNTWLATWYPGRSPHVDYRPMMRDLSGLSGDQLDRVFLQDMIRHHMAAVMMSQQFLGRDLARHRQVNALAVSIRDGQHAEIFQMAHWLDRWYRVGEDRPMGPGMMW